MSERCSGLTPAPARSRPAVISFRRFGAAAHLAAGSTERGADAVFGHAHLAADLLVTLAFQVIHAHDLSLGSFELRQQSLDFLAIADALFCLAVRRRRSVRGIVISQAGRRLS